MATKRKVRRYNGEEGSEVDPLEAANASEESQAIANEAKGDTILKRMRDEAATPSFKEAFAAARGAKQGTFEWNGKKYTTALAGEKKAAPSAKAVEAKPSGAGAGRGGQGAPSAAELESYAKKQTIKRALTPPSAEDTQKGLEIMAGGPSLKAVQTAAKSLASRGAARAKDYVQPQLTSTPKQLPAPTSRIGYDKAGAKAKEREARASQREREKEDFNRRTNELREADSPYKKGGNVRGWGMARGARKAKIV